MLEITTYKNYKELIKALEWEEKKSNNRTGQMKQLEAICKYHKEGQKFVIEEIYEEPKEIIDNRGKATIYADSFRPLVLNVLSQHYKKKEITLCISSSMVMKDFAMADEELINYYNKLDGISKGAKDKTENTIAKDGAVIDYINRYRRKTMDRFTTVLKQLEKESLIRFYPNYIRVKESNGKYYWASDEQIKALMNLEKEVLLDLSEEKGVEIKKNHLKKYGLQTVFRNRVSKKLKQTEEVCIRNIELYFNAIKIILTDKFTIQLLDEKNKLINSVKYLQLSKSSDIKSKDNDIESYKKTKMKQAENYANNEEHFEEYLNKRWDKNKRGLKSVTVEQWKNNKDIKEEFLEITKVRYEMYIGEYKEEYNKAIEKLYNKLDEMEFDLDYLIDINEFDGESVESKLKKLDSIDVDIIKKYLKEREGDEV